MKKIFALILAVLMVLTACSKVPEEADPQFQYNEKIPKTEATRSPDEDAPAEMRVLSASEVQIDVEIKNISEDEIIFSEDFLVQFKEDGKWYNLEYIADEVVFNQPAYFVEPGESREWNGNFSWFYGKLPEGEYRILKTVVTDKTFVIGAEFCLPFVLKENPEEPSEPEITAPEHLAYLRENFPKIDGSTSLIPLEAGIRAEIFGKTMGEATLDVSHTTTWGSFENLLAGNVDMIFTCEMSEEQWKMADEAGITLEAISVAMEGFVFVVNADNPVDVLTQEQLRDIYSGKITNWKEVGGNDAEIIAYQRNEDSGSQNYMIEFMGEVPLTDAPEYKRPGSMGGLMDAVAVNDYAVDSIGYSVYAYAADMYGNGDEIKFIKVDGIEPNKENMLNGTYPLLGYNYAVFNTEEPKGGAVRNLVEWIISDEGQLAVAKAGYVTVRDIGFNYSDSFELFEATGTGIKKPEPFELPRFEYLYSGGEEYIPLELGTHSDGTATYKIKFLENKELEDEINAFILENVKKLEKKYGEYSDYLEVIKGNEEWEEYQKGFTEPYYSAYIKSQKTAVIVKAKNGYLSVAVTLPYLYAVQDGADLFYDTETAVWDVISGKRLSFEELFYEGTDIDSVLNQYLNFASVDQGMTEFNIRHEMKTDFAGLTNDGDWHIDLDTVYFDYGNRYFYDSPGFNISEISGAMVTEQPRDMSGCFTSESYKTFTTPKLKTIRKTLEEKPEYMEKYGGYQYSLLDEKVYPNAGKINAVIEKYVTENLKRETVLEFYKEYNLSEDEKEELFIWDGGYFEYFGNRYVIFRCSYIHSKWINRAYKDIWYDKNAYLFFDLETGEQISWKNLLSEKGKETAKKYPELKDNFVSVFPTENGITVYHNEGWKSHTFKDDEVNWE